MLPAANVTPRPRRSASGGALRLAAAVVLLVALLALCLARADAAASLAGRATASEKGMASSLENTRALEVARGHYTTLPAVTVEGEDYGAVVPERELEMIEDYTPTGPNNKHEPRHP